MIAHRRQKHARGCVIACLSMLTGVPYDEVLQGFKGDRDAEGLSSFHYDIWLNQRGYAVLRRYQHYGPLQADRVAWPCPPFADQHLVTVEIPGGSHAIVMLRDGTVYDPNKDAPGRLSDYEKVAYVAGIFRVCEPFPPEPLIGLHWSCNRKCMFCGAEVETYKYHDPCPARGGLTTP